MNNLIGISQQIWWRVWGTIRYLSMLPGTIQYTDKVIRTQFLRMLALVRITFGLRALINSHNFSEASETGLTQSYENKRLDLLESGNSLESFFSAIFLVREFSYIKRELCRRNGSAMKCLSYKELTRTRACLESYDCSRFSYKRREARIHTKQ